MCQEIAFFLNILNAEACRGLTFHSHFLQTSSCLSSCNIFFSGRFARRRLDDYTPIETPIRYEPCSWRDTASVAGYGKRGTATPRLKSVPGQRHNSIQEGWEPKAQEQADLRLYAKYRIRWGSSSMRCVCAHPSISTEVHVNLLLRPKQSSDPSTVSRFCFKPPTLNSLNTPAHGSES